MSSLSSAFTAIRLFSPSLFLVSDFDSLPLYSDSSLLSPALPLAVCAHPSLHSSSIPLWVSISPPFSLSASPSSRYLFLLPSPGLLSAPSVVLSLTLCCFYPNLTLLSGPPCFPLLCVGSNLNAAVWVTGPQCIRAQGCTDAVDWCIFFFLSMRTFDAFAQENISVCKRSYKRLCFKASALPHLATACTVHTLPFFRSFCPLSSLIPALSFNPSLMLWLGILEMDLHAHMQVYWHRLTHTVALLLVFKWIWWCWFRLRESLWRTIFKKRPFGYYGNDSNMNVTGSS